MVPELVVVVFERPGPLGLQFSAGSYDEPGVPVMLSEVEPESEAATHGQLRPGTKLYRSVLDLLVGRYNKTA